MRSSVILAILAPVFALLWLASCGGGGGLSAVDDGVAQTGDVALGDAWTGDGGADSTAVDIYDLPGLLDAWKETAAGDGEWSEENRFHKGKEYEYDLPRHYISTPYPSYEMVYSPVDGPNGSAYAFYQFPLAGYDGDPVIYFDWEVLESSEVETELWVGLVNLDELDWDWFNGNLTDPVDPGSLDPYLSADGNLRMGVLLFGEGEYQLNWVRVGGNIAPVIELTTDPVEGPAGRILVNAIPSSDLDGEITLCEYDTDGDGIFETSNGDCRFLYTEIDTPGTHQVGVRFTDDSGVSIDDSAVVEINDWVEELLIQGDGYDFAACNDALGNAHIACSTNPVEPGGSGNLTYLTNETGEWVALNVLQADWFYDPEIKVDPSGKLVIAAIRHDESGQTPIQFARRESDGWQNMDSWLLNQDTAFSMLEFCLDSNGLPHMAHGFRGDLIYSGSFDYSYFNGTDWVLSLENVPASQLQMGIDANDRPQFMFKNIALASIFSCISQGDGYYFRMETELADLGGFEVNSLGSQAFTHSSAYIRDPMEHVDNLAVYFNWHNLFRVEDYEEEDSHEITSDCVLNASDNATVCFQWYFYDSSEETRTVSTACVQDLGFYDWQTSWISYSNCYSYIDYDVLLDAQGKPLIIASKIEEEYIDGQYYMHAYGSLVAIHPRE